MHVLFGTTLCLVFDNFFFVVYRGRRSLSGPLLILARHTQRKRGILNSTLLFVNASELSPHENCLQMLVTKATIGKETYILLNFFLDELSSCYTKTQFQHHFFTHFMCKHAFILISP